jgi:hypothetical protein
MYILKFSFTTILTLIYPFFSPHILSAATLSSSNFISLSQTTSIHQSNENEEWRGQALIKTGARYLADGQKEKAFESLNEGLQTIQETRGVRSLTYYLSEEELELIAQAYTAAEQYDSVLLISATKDSETVARILNATSHKIALTGQYKRAFKLAQALKSDWDKTSVLADVIEVAVEAGHYEEILKTAQSLECYSCKDYAFVLIADYYAAIGEYNHALELVQNVDNAYKAQSLVSIANYLGVVGQKERASELLIQALEINQNLPLNKKLRIVEIAIGLAAAGQYDKALELASTLDPGNPKENLQPLVEKTLALGGIAAHYAANEQREDALKVLNQALEFDKIASGQYRCPVRFVKPMLHEIAYRYAAMGEYDKSLKIAVISQDESFKLELLNEVIPKYVEASRKKSRQIRLASIPGGQCGG